MGLMIRMTPELERDLAREAERHGETPDEVVAQRLRERLPEGRTEARETLRIENQKERNSAAQAALCQLMEEKATSDPDEIAQRQRELDEFKAALNANRRATQERLLYP